VALEAIQKVTDLDWTAISPPARRKAKISSPPRRKR
jgi:hypothetical protein